jgi:tetratricopeptide (TPR) repeat protein
MKRIVLAVLVVTSIAYADDKDKEKADALFKQGKKLMGERKFSEACDVFEEVMTLDPGIGAELNIARCYEEWGKLARAFRAYKQADKMAKDASDSRAAKIEALIKQLDPTVPRLTMIFPPEADARSVTIDGAPIEDITQPVLLDPGPHKVEYTTSSGGKKSKTIAIEKGEKLGAKLHDLPPKVALDDAVDRPPPAPPGPPPPPSPPPTESTPSAPDPGRNFRLAAYGVGGAGVVAVGISSYLALSARSKYNDALKTDCMGKTNACSAAGLTATHDARHEANVATVVFSLGLAAVGGGVVLYLIAPHATQSENADEALYLVPSVDANGAGLVFGGGF